MTEYLLSVPLKKSSELDLVKPLKTLIGSLYSTVEPGSRTADFTPAINEFNRLRSNAIKIVSTDTKGASHSGLEALQKYYDQLSNLEMKIPAHEVNIAFKWKDAFDQGSFFGGKVSLSVPSFGFEKSCILFNIAAMESQLGAATRISDTDEELKSAAKLFASAAGIFEHLRTTLASSGVLGGQEPTPDLSTESLSILANLMTAQAQEIYIHKAVGDKLKDAILAKLCIQAEDMYADLLRTIQKESSQRVDWDKEWTTTIAGKQAGYAGIANFYQASVCGTKGLIGEQIARLTLCLDYIKQAQIRAGSAALFTEFSAKATRALADAKKDNDFIYHERIPEANSLAGIEKVASARLAKPTPVPTSFGTAKALLFDDLVPVPVHQATAAAELRKSEMINSRIGQLREGTAMLNSVMASLNLPAAIEETGSGSNAGAIPESLREKSEQIVAAGGIHGLEAAIQELPSLVQRNREILDETQKLIQEEEETDAKLRAQFGPAKWTRIASDKLNGTFKTNAGKYRAILDNALQADEIVQGKLRANRQGIEILSGGVAALQAKLPQRTPADASASGGSAAAKEKLRHLCVQAENLKSARESIESEIKALTFDLKSEFLRALAQDGVIDEPVISTQILGGKFEQIDYRLKKSLADQEALISQIQQAADEYFGGKPGGGGMESDRDALMKQLAEAYDAFMDLQSNVKEGTKFYNDLTQLLLTFQSKISDYCFARKTEKEELLQDVIRETTATGGAASNAPAAPPPRPPQPAAYTPPATAAPPATQQQPQQHPQPGQYQMPMPYASQAAPYPYMVPPPMPMAYNPWATYGPPQGQPGQAPLPYPVQPVMHYPPQGYYNPGQPPQQQHQQHPPPQ